MQIFRIKLKEELLRKNKISKEVKTLISKATKELKKWNNIFVIFI